MPNQQTISLSNADVKYFEESILLAEQSLEKQEVPVGCVIVFKENIIGRGMNKVNESKNATKHAEFVAFREAEEWCIKNQHDFSKVIQNSSLYVSLEPCVMCASALYLLKIRKIVFGACNPRFGGIKSVASNTLYGYEHEIEIISEIDVERSLAMLRRFYERENPFAPDEKRKSKNYEI